jgi:uncharacterized alpha/beta hydrolase family protein
MKLASVKKVNGAVKVTILAVLMCFSCMQADHRTNAALRCNVLEVPLKGSPHKYKNELVKFYLKNDSLSIHSLHLNLTFSRNEQLESRLPAINHVRKQFIFKDQSNELYKVLYTQNKSHSKFYLYLCIVNVRHAAPMYLFTNDPAYVK